jgi:hypothetical protein
VSSGLGAKAATLSGCRVLECEAFDISRDEALELLLTSEAVLVRGGGRNSLQLDGLEINRIEIQELFPPSSRKRQAGRAVLGTSLVALFGLFAGLLSAGDGWSAADELLESHTVKVTLLTSRGRIVVVRTSREKPEDLHNRLEPLGALIASAPAAKQLAALYDKVEKSGSVTVMVKDLLLRLGEIDSTPEARVRATKRLAHGGLTASPALSALGLSRTSEVTLKRQPLDQ